MFGLAETIGMEAYIPVKVLIKAPLENNSDT